MCRPPSGPSPPVKSITHFADLPLYQLFSELATVFSNLDKSQRGVFQRIHAEEIDLPTNRPPPDPATAQLWIERLPDEFRDYFAQATSPFRASVTEHLKTAKSIGSMPHAWLYASKTEYAALLAKAKDARMLHWSVLSTEDNHYCAMASEIQMTLFAVSKSHNRSRLISWPRVQNDAIQELPFTSLPHPSMFEAIRQQGSALSSFFLDISNMFHNITLSLWLSRLLPMPPILFSHLPIETQRRIAKRTHIHAQNTEFLIRPSQATMPMGFKWAVFIDHNFLSSYFDEPFKLLKSSRLAFSSMILSKLHAADAPFLVSQRTPLLLHVIDDAVVVAVDWPTVLLTTWHKITRTILRVEQLPVAHNKSSHPLTIVQDSISFIGCKWHLKHGIIEPASDKLKKITSRVKSLLEAQACSSKDRELIVGKLLWFFQSGFFATLN